MKITLVLVVIASFCLSMTFAQPVVSSLGQGLSLLVKEESESPVEELQYFEEDSQEVLGSRIKRATCDLLSFDTKFGSLNHSACALHCLAMRRGFKGGRCRDGVCHCRK